MKLVRIGILTGIVMSGVFVTLYGGTVPYRLFYFFLAIPVLCFLYTLYVYSRFKVYQSVERKTLVKEEAAGYQVQVGNEDFITYENMKLVFFDDYSLIQDVEELNEYCLLPGQKKEQKTSVLCKYRGNYPIGVKAVQITDFLHLFHITYPILSVCKVSVLPKLISLERCFFLEDNWDEKRTATAFSMEEAQRDVETRQYQPGDDKRMIHWKASVKQKQLFVRKWSGVTKPEVTIVMECRLTKDSDPIREEDQMLETALAIAYYCTRKNTLCHMIYEQDKVKSRTIYDYVSFDSFYQDTVHLAFRGKLSMSDLLEQSTFPEHQILVLLTVEMTDVLLGKISQLGIQNRSITAFVMGAEPAGWKEPFPGASIRFLTADTDKKQMLEEGAGG